MSDVRGSMLKKEKLKIVSIEFQMNSKFQIPMSKTKADAGVFSSLFSFPFSLFPFHFLSPFTDLEYLFNFELRTSNFEPICHHV